MDTLWITPQSITQDRIIARLRHPFTVQALPGKDTALPGSPHPLPGNDTRSRSCGKLSRPWLQEAHTCSALLYHQLALGLYPPECLARVVQSLAARPGRQLIQVVVVAQPDLIIGAELRHPGQPPDCAHRRAGHPGLRSSAACQRPPIRPAPGSGLASRQHRAAPPAGPTSP